MSNVLDFNYYCPRVLKIKTKTLGSQPFRLRQYQLKYIQHLKDSFPDGITRSVVLKCRQAGFSTIVAGINVHAMATRYNERGIMLADKFSRTKEVHGIYSHFVDNIPDKLKPMIAKNNEEEISFDNPNKDLRNTKQGLGSGIVSYTALDENAGRSGTRMFAHLTEMAFYRYAMQIDEATQNSIPLAKGTRIIKESTANGMTSNGEAFYNLWMAAEAGDSIYKPYFVAWHEIDDYQLPVPMGFILTPKEIEIVRMCPTVTNANLVWRRLKISEYSSTSDSPLPPEERFAQDFPSYPSEAFLSTGRPVFDMHKLKEHAEELKRHPPKIQDIKIKQTYLAMYPQLLTVYFTPQKGMKYSIGADVALGLDIGDASHGKILDSDHKEIAHFHGQIDPDHFGRCLVELARIYNNAIIVPERNSMGHTTLNAIKEMGYTRIYNSEVNDELDQHKTTNKVGWVTTTKSKQLMLNGLIASYRDNDIVILDIGTINEMIKCTRESDGNVELNGKDRLVATCLALQGFNQIYEPAVIYDPARQRERLILERSDKSRDVITRRAHAKATDLS